MILNNPVRFTNREADALLMLAAVAIVRAETNGEKMPHIRTAAEKIQRSKCGGDIEIPEERLKVLEY